MEYDELENAELITVKEAARILGLAPKTIFNRKGGTGELLRIHQGGSVRLLRDEVIRHKGEVIKKAEDVRRMIYGY